MTLEELNQAEDDAFSMAEYKKKIQKNLLELCFVKQESPEELEHFIQKYSLVGKVDFRKKSVLKALNEGCRFFNITDYDAFLNGFPIADTDYENLFEKIMSETIDGKLQWKRQSVTISDMCKIVEEETARHIPYKMKPMASYITYDWEFYSKSKSSLRIVNLYDEFYSLTFKGKYKASEAPVIIMSHDKVKELYGLISKSHL